jgi:hypothetical protein
LLFGAEGDKYIEPSQLRSLLFFFLASSETRTRLKEFGNAKFFVNSRKRVRGSSPVIRSKEKTPTRWVGAFSLE